MVYPSTERRENALRRIKIFVNSNVGKGSVAGATAPEGNFFN
jgi:hypothetical protein